MQDARSPGPTVAVIGGGFSGLLTAIHLLAGHRRIRVRLVERAPQFGRGRAYNASDAGHMLNVRAANMSAFPDLPHHFTHWLAQQGSAADTAGFVTRQTYGDYLQSVLRDAVCREGGRGHLLLELDECVDLTPAAPGYDVHLAVGRSFRADAVVLAVGAGPPPALPGIDPDASASPAFFADPWRPDVRETPARDILLLGSGLTMVDVATSLAKEGRTFTVLSRRGLLPRGHAPTAPAPLPPGSLETPLNALKALRAHAASVGWREAIDSVRALTPAIWRSWSLDQRRRFLRHAAPWWDVHRHRMAPTVAARLDKMVEAGELRVLAGRLETLSAASDGLSALIRLRGRRTHLRQTFGAVVNCTGLSGRLDSGGPLLRSLLLRGLIRPDALGLGLDFDDDFAVVGRGGARTRCLWALGPLARAARWETVAVPDLRTQTAETAQTVLTVLRSPLAAAPRL